MPGTCRRFQATIDAACWNDLFDGGRTPPVHYDEQRVEREVAKTRLQIETLGGDPR